MLPVWWPPAARLWLRFSVRGAIGSPSAGASLVASLEREVSGLVGVPPRGSKESRLQAVLAFFDAANVHLPEGWPGLDAAVAELTTFPNARHDDFVDALTLALAELATRGSAVEHWHNATRATRAMARIIADPWGRG